MHQSITIISHERTGTMRKLIVANIISLDGCYEGPDRNVMSLPMDEAFDIYNAERLAEADTMLLGRATYELFRGFWPTVAEQIDLLSSLSPAGREANLAIGRRMDVIDKVVVSNTLQPESPGAWQRPITVVDRANIHDTIDTLKQRHGKDIIVFGSRTLWTDLLAHGLVDEVHIMIGAVMLGGGTPVFGHRHPASFELIGTRTWDSSDNVVLKYRPRPSPST